jgi:hypothetical protein
MSVNRKFLDDLRQLINSRNKIKYYCMTSTGDIIVPPEYGSINNNHTKYKYCGHYSIILAPFVWQDINKICC